jgi:transcriptional accessory protein Tex/SPT6
MVSMMSVFFRFGMTISIVIAFKLAQMRQIMHLSQFYGGKYDAASKIKKSFYPLELSKPKPTKDVRSLSVEPSHTIVLRMFPDIERKRLDSFQIGQQCVGQVISIVKHGFFIDIGTSKDCLLHISDVSAEYFVKETVSRFNPGDKIDVWIKFVDTTTQKIGLQLFPPFRSSAGEPVEKVPISSFSIESTVSGQVVRVSELGVFVDIGADVPAFLAKRKMKIAKRRFNFKSVLFFICFLSQISPI